MSINIELKEDLLDRSMKIYERLFGAARDEGLVLDYLKEVFAKAGWDFVENHVRWGDAVIATKKRKWVLPKSGLECYTEYRPKSCDVTLNTVGLKTFPHYVKCSLYDPQFEDKVRLYLEQAKQAYWDDKAAWLTDRLYGDV